MESDNDHQDLLRKEMPTAVHVDLQFLARLFTGWYPCKPLLVILGFKYFPSSNYFMKEWQRFRACKTPNFMTTLDIERQMGRK